VHSTQSVIRSSRPIGSSVSGATNGQIEPISAHALGKRSEIITGPEMGSRIPPAANITKAASPANVRTRPAAAGMLFNRMIGSSGLPSAFDRNCSGAAARRRVRNLICPMSGCDGLNGPVLCFKLGDLGL
jgi:hypothetical protein